MNKKAFSLPPISLLSIFAILFITGCQTNLSGTDLSGNLGQVINNNNLTPEQQKIATLENQNQNLQEDLALKNSLLEEFEKKNYDLLRQVHPNVFDYDYIKVGDKIGELTVSAIGSEPASTAADGTTVAAYQYAEFTGTLQLSGTYTYYDQNDQFLADQVCFGNLSAESLNKLPVEMERFDLQDHQFCFENQDLARSVFGKPGSTGPATIEISDFSSNNAEFEAWPTAKLEKIIK
jgi:hypothetical protein